MESTNMSVIKSPDLINLNDTDTDAEIQYKSLGATNGDAAADADELRPSADSPTVSSPASDSPKSTHTNHVHWQTTLCEEARQLLATEGESSERHSSEEEVDVWRVSAEQRHYYVQQFLTLQPEVAGLVPGHTAKAFFEKSKLPVAALSKIWNLSDVTRDGCLCLEEFVTAMHLVVLRRNRIEIPDQLPASLQPKVSVNGAAAAPRPSEPTAAGSAPTQSSASAASLVSPKGKEWTKFVESPMSNISSPGIKPVNFDFHRSAVEQNPQILHPVAVKGTREEQDRLQDSDSETTSPEPALSAPAPPAPPAPAPAMVLSNRHAHRVVLRQSSSGPAVTTAAAESGPTSLPALAQTAPALPCRVLPAAPPPPPPRPGHGSHARSSSLDLSRVTPQQPLPPLVPPRGSPHDVARGAGRLPQFSAADAGAEAGGFADFSQFQEPTPEAARQRQGAFEVYKKPGAAAGSPVSADPHTESAAAAASSPAALLAPCDLPLSEPAPHQRGRSQMSEAPAISPARLAKMTVQDLIGMGPWRRETLEQLIRTQRERTASLAAVTAELNQELAEAVEERTSLELQLDHLRPSSH